MEGPNFDQRGQRVESQLNVGGDLVLNLPASAPEPGRLVGRVPARAAFFTGRTDMLNRLHVELAVADGIPRALSGMAGLGKTTIAVEYVYRAWPSFSTVAWVVAETPEELRAALAGLAPELGLGLPPDVSQAVAFNAVSGWFVTHQDWLLVADNVESIAAVREILPQGAGGRFLLTTRREDLGGGVVPLRLDCLDETAGALLLLRRAGGVGPAGTLADVDEAWRSGALALTHAFDGLPLALDQAGAYLASRHRSPAEYLELFLSRRKEMLERGGGDAPRTVAVTLDLAFRQTETIPKFGPAVADLARLAAFLAPDPIPDAIFREGAETLEEPLRSLARDDLDWDDIVEASTRFSLLGRSAGESGFVVHRLVAAVVRDGLDDADRRLWTERATTALATVFPDTSYPTWPLCERLLPHAFALSEAISEAPSRPGLSLLNRATLYLTRRARLDEAERLLRLAIEATRQLEGDGHPSLAILYSNLGEALRQLGRYAEAVGSSEAAVRIVSAAPEGDHLTLADLLDNLGGIYMRLGRFENAERCRRQALEITRAKLGPRAPRVGVRLSNLSSVLDAQGRYREAVPLALRSLAVKAATGNGDDPECATGLANLGNLYLKIGLLDRAEAPLRRSLAIRDRAFGGHHPDCADSRFWLARWSAEKGELAVARELMTEAIALWSALLPPSHPALTAAQKGLQAIRRLEEGSIDRD